MTRNWGSPTLVNMGMILSLSLFHLGATKHVEHLRCRPRLQDGIGCELLGLRIIGSPNPFNRLREIVMSMSLFHIRSDRYLGGTFGDCGGSTFAPLYAAPGGTGRDATFIKQPRRSRTRYRAQQPALIMPQ